METLNSWHEIASFLNSSTRSAQRWERQEGLPIHRGGTGKAVVFAFPTELEHWLRIRTRVEKQQVLRATLQQLMHNQRQKLSRLKRRIRNVGRDPRTVLQTKVDDALRRKAHIFVEAQERERVRIAQELHDDINQRLALVAIGLGQIQRNNVLSPEARDQAGKIAEEINGIAHDLHAVAHELHPSNLEYLGLVGAIQGLCRGIAHRRTITINFVDEDVPRSLPSDVSHCLFRVVQEGLHNAVRHSGATHIEVRLRGGEKEVHLTISDTGVGFDVRNGMNGRGLGLTSMRERVRLIKGTIVIRSRPSAGTTIHVCIPLNS